MTEQIEKAPQAYFEEDMAEPVLHTLPAGEAVVFTTSNPEKDTPNEDAAAIIHATPSDSVLVLADGMGGRKSGGQASKLAIDSLRDSVAHATTEEDLMIRTAILNGIETASRDVLAMGVGAGTTIAVIEVQDGTIRPYHVGDSMILVTGQRGMIKLQTVAHSPVGFAVEAGILDEDEAMHHEERHLVLNMVGSSDMRIEVGPILKLAPRDTVLLASDGLIDNLTVEEIVSLIRKGPLKECVRQVAEKAQKRMETPESSLPCKPDDLTLIAYRSK